MTDSETPTPRASGLWRQWREHADVIEVRLRAWATLRRKRLELLDLAGADAADRLADQALGLADAFGRWGDVPPADEERSRRITELADLQRAAEELMAKGRP